MRQAKKVEASDEREAKREPAGKAATDKRSSDRADPYPSLPRRNFFRVKAEGEAD